MKYIVGLYVIHMLEIGNNEEVFGEGRVTTEMKNNAAQRLSKISDKHIQDLVMQYIPEQEIIWQKGSKTYKYENTVADILIARKKFIIDKWQKQTF